MYSKREHDAALNKILAALDDMTCPDCGGPLECLAAHDAEPDTNTAAWNGGCVCHGCGYATEVEPQDENAGACVPVVKLGPGGDFTREWHGKDGK